MDTRNRSSFVNSGPWTNEKHLHYLNSMEASFVHTMFENNGRLLRLDRYLPDTSDSTLDLKTKKHATSSAHDIKTGIDSRPYTSSQDQVVPQMGNRR